MTRLPGVLILEAEPSVARALAHTGRGDRVVSRSDLRRAGVPVVALEALVTRVRLRKVEWRVIVGLLVTGAPLTARQLARWLGLDYATTKRTVRELLAWNLLERAPVGVGVRFQPDASRWREPTATREPGP